MLMRVLILDDEPGIRSGLVKILEYKGYETREADNIASAREILKDADMDCVLLDMKIGEESGMDFLDYVSSKNLDLSVIVMTGYGDIQNTVQCMKKGAVNYLTKPLDNELLLSILERESEIRRTHSEAESLKVQLEGYQNQEPVLIDSGNPQMQKILKVLQKVSGSPVPILINGETGTGKEVTARYIHKLSDRRDHPFISLNCASLNDNLLESELFGHVKGAFTGALKDKPGRFELAGEGTLFLDELGDMSLLMQVKLLRILQEGTYEKVGGQQDLSL